MRSPSRRSLTDLPIVWRPRRGRIVAYTMASVALATMVTLAIVIAPPFRLADRIGLVLFGALVAAVLHLIGRVRVIADDRGLTVVNVLRTHRYEWAEVVGVNMGIGEPWPTLDLADGSSVGAMGIQGAERDRAAKAIGELRALLQRYGEAPDR